MRDVTPTVGGSMGPALLLLCRSAGLRDEMMTYCSDFSPPDWRIRGIDNMPIMVGGVFCSGHLIPF